MAQPIYRRSGKIWLLLACLIAPLPSFLKRPLYRGLFGYHIGKRVRIGLSVIIAGECTIKDDAKIGHFNLFLHNGRLEIGSLALIRFGNIIRGGRCVVIADRCLIDRFNEINSIIDPEVDALPVAADSLAGTFEAGPNTVITAQHKIDFTGGVSFGESVILGGRLSSLWTHNRQADGAITVGRNTYLGSGLQMVPHSSIGEYCVAGIGTVVTKPLAGDYSLIGGVPAKIIKPLDDDQKILVTYPTRPELEGVDDTLPTAS
ncbi:hypothetical protein [Pontixanthobacter sp. CEM42]|uniref:hypothetical protein n=1 Tax=Pontixanthobacter sp. CEM42 TaxID=2792077 RepID=UPI001ADEEB31|nr:hypothetical protein [Pontixanthobacter sp. CEM42]